MFASEVTRIIWLNNSTVMKLLQLFSHCSLEFLSKTFQSLFDTVLGQDGIICDDSGCWSGSKKISDGFDDVDISLSDIMEIPVTKNQVAPYHELSIGSFIILVDSGRVP